MFSGNIGAVVASGEPGVTGWRRPTGYQLVEDITSR
jgi:hypothetical protein